MAKAKVLVKRRKSVRNTKKITRTMEMVSTAKYKQSHDRVVRSAPYQAKLRELMADLAGAAGDVSHPLLVSRTVKKSLIFLITSNRGMCAGYNANLCLTAREVMTREREQGAETELHVVGKKGTQYFRHRGEEAAASYVHFGDRIPYAEVDRIASGLIERYSRAEIDRVTIVYQKFFSAGRQAPVEEVLLPLTAVQAAAPAASAAPAGGKSWAANYIFSPDPAALMQELLPAYFKSTLYGDFLQAAVGEHRARMVAMKNATDAADKLIKQLTRLYNRARQSQITNEIAELMGGVEALK
jgi:F-type H+-transporting ATPase subunit gamma